MQQGTFLPFRTALQKALIANGSSLEQFTAEASKLLSRRRLYRADGAAVRDASAGDAASASFLALMQNVAQHMIDCSHLTLQDVANYEMYLFFTSCLLGTALPQTGQMKALMAALSCSYIVDDVILM